MPAGRRADRRPRKDPAPRCRRAEWRRGCDPRCRRCRRRDGSPGRRSVVPAVGRAADRRIADPLRWSAPASGGPARHQVPAGRAVGPTCWRRPDRSLHPWRPAREPKRYRRTRALVFVRSTAPVADPGHVPKNRWCRRRCVLPRPAGPPTTTPARPAKATASNVRPAVTADLGGDGRRPRAGGHSRVHLRDCAPQSASERHGGWHGG